MLGFKNIITIISTVLLSSCAADISSNTYALSQVGEAASTYQGTIINMREVKVKQTNDLGRSNFSSTAAVITGGLLGSQIGYGRGAATALGGAAVGGLVGAIAQEATTKQTAFEYIIKLTNGQILNVVQGKDIVFKVGDLVLVTVSNDGRSRVILDNSAL